MGRHCVGVYEDTWEKGRTDTWSITYFDEYSIVGKWKDAHNVSLSSENWHEDFKAKQKSLIADGIRLDEKLVSDKITVRIGMLANQPDPIFGEKNKNLGGNAVTKIIFFWTVENEIEIDYPLD